MKKPVILKLGGGNGSGKSSLARVLLGTAPVPFYDDLVPGKVAGYTCEFEGIKIRVLGRYESACGGVDAIGKIDKWLPLVEKYSTDTTVDALFFEGILSGQTFGRCGEFSNTQVGRWLYAVVDAPVEVCLERILERRRAKGNMEGRTEALEKSVKNAHRCAGAVPRLAAEHGHATLVLDHTKTPKALAKRLVKECVKVRDAG